jgi:rhodanese-related sulfurtransferase
MELKACLESRREELMVLDLRERDAYESVHIPGAVHLPRGQLELRVNEDLKDPTENIGMLRIRAHFDSRRGDAAHHGKRATRSPKAGSEGGALSICDVLAMARADLSKQPQERP